MVEPRHHFTEITCPDTGRPIMVARSLRDDPVGALNQITHHQREAAAAYVSDHEATSGQLRAPNHGPEDTAWRQRRSGGDQLRKPHDRLKRAHAALGPDRSMLIKSLLVDGDPPIRIGDLRQLYQALDQLAVAYGLSTPTRH